MTSATRYVAIVPMDMIVKSPVLTDHTQPPPPANSLGDLRRQLAEIGNEIYRLALTAPSNMQFKRHRCIMPGGALRLRLLRTVTVMKGKQKR